MKTTRVLYFRPDRCIHLACFGRRGAGGPTACYTPRYLLCVTLEANCQRHDYCRSLLLYCCTVVELVHRIGPAIEAWGRAVRSCCCVLTPHQLLRGKIATTAAAAAAISSIALRGHTAPVREGTRTKHCFRVPICSRHTVLQSISKPRHVTNQSSPHYCLYCCQCTYTPCPLTHHLASG